jgi:hypothetical protein
MKHYLALSFILSLILMGCGNDEKPLSACDLAPCDPQKKTVKVVADQEGRIGFSEEEGKWLIIASIPETYDSQDIGIVCTGLPENLQEVDREVLFSGTYKERCNEAKGVLPGQIYYELHLTEIKAL